MSALGVSGAGCSARAAVASRGRTDLLRVGLFGLSVLVGAYNRAHAGDHLSRLRP